MISEQAVNRAIAVLEDADTDEAIRIVARVVIDVYLEEQHQILVLLGACYPGRRVTAGEFAPYDA